MKKTQGHNITEFIIIIALIAIAGIVVLTMLGDEVNSLFKSSKSKYKEHKPFQWEGKNTKGGSLGGTPEKPVRKCTGDSCTIDFGEFLLTNVPSDFGDFVTTNGASGGTDALLDLVEQVAEQLEAKGDVDGAAEYRDLANLGHFMASVEKKVEEAAEACGEEKDSLLCFNNSIARLNSSELPDNIKHLMSSSAFQFLASSTNLNIDYALHSYYTDKSRFKDTARKQITYAISDKFMNIINNDKYSDSMKGVTVQLMEHMNSLSRDLSQKIWVSVDYEKRRDDYTTTYDLVTGEIEGSYRATFSDMEDITRPQVSMNNNLDSALICASGKNSDLGTKCN